MADLTPQTKRMNDCCNILPNVQHICTSSRRAVSMTSQINSKASEGFSEFTNDFDVNLGKKTTCGEHDKWRSCPQLVSNSLFTFLFLRTESRSHTRATKVVNSKLNSISALHPAQGDNTGRLHHHRPPVPRGDGYRIKITRSKITACSSRVNATRWMTVVSALAQYCTRLILGRSSRLSLRAGLSLETWSEFRSCDKHLDLASSVILIKALGQVHRCSGWMHKP